MVKTNVLKNLDSEILLLLLTSSREHLEKNSYRRKSKLTEIIIILTKYLNDQ